MKYLKEFIMQNEPDETTEPVEPQTPPVTNQEPETPVVTEPTEPEAAPTTPVPVPIDNSHHEFVPTSVSSADLNNHLSAILADIETILSNVTTTLSAHRDVTGLYQALSNARDWAANELGLVKTEAGWIRKT